MTSMNLADRVRTAFADPETKQYANTCLEVIRTNWRQAESDERRATISLSVLVICFELIVLGLVKTIDIPVIKEAPLALIARAIPAIIAYNYYLILYLIRLRRRFEQAHSYILAETCNSIIKSNLDLLLHPHFLPMYGDLREMRATNRFVKVDSLLSVTCMVLVLVGPPLFIIGAFVQLVVTQVPHNVPAVALWTAFGLSAWVSAIFLIKAVALIAFSAHDK